jgi:hypothetical protein
MATQWFWREGDEERGPVSFRELARMVGEHLLDEDDFVRPEYSRTWQSTDSVVGLYHMAGKPLPIRSDAEPASPHSVPEETLSATAPLDHHSDSIQDSEHPGVIPGTSTPRLTWWGSRRPISATRTTVPGMIDDPSGMEATPEPSIGGPPTINDASSTPAPDGQIALAIDAAVEAWDERHAETVPDVPEVSRSSWFASGVRPLVVVASVIANVLGILLEGVLRTGQFVGVGAACRWLDRVINQEVMSWGFRAGCSMTTATVVAWGLVSWSRQETLRFPDAEMMAAGKTLLPFVGPCSPIESLLILVEVMAVSAVVGYFMAIWLESLTDAH